MIYLQLLFEFFKAGLFAIGGGLATVPYVYDMAHSYQGWFTGDDVTRMIAIAQSLPGAFAVNLAAQSGLTVAGVPGGVSAVAGLVTAPLIFAVIIAKMMIRYFNGLGTQSLLYALRPASAGLIAGTMFPVLLGTLINTADYSFNQSSAILFLLTMLAIFVISKSKRALHPLVLIAAGAVWGIFLL